MAFVIYPETQREHGESTLQLKVHASGLDPEGTDLSQDNLHGFVNDEKDGFHKDIDNRPPSSGYASSGGSSPNSIKKKKKQKNGPRRRSLTTMLGQDHQATKEEKPSAYLLSSLVNPISPEVTRPTSRSSVVSRQEIRTMFGPRMSVDEGSGPHTIPSIGD